MSLRKLRNPLFAVLGTGLLSATAQTTTHSADAARAPASEIEVEVIASPITQFEETTSTARTAWSWGATSLIA